MKDAGQAAVSRIGLRVSFALVLALTMGLPRASAAPAPYAITDLGTLGGPQSDANAINNSGQIVGSADLAGTNNPHINHAFLYSGGVMNDLGVLGAYSNGTVFVSISAALGINNNGQIVGDSRTSSQAIHAFLYDQGQMTDLGTLPANTQSEARSINDNGQIVGWTLPAGPQHAFLYENGNMTDLGTLGGTASFAYSINNAGQFVGDSWTNTSGLSDVGYVYSNGVMTALGNLGVSPVIQGLAINDSGQIAGYAGAVSTGGPTVTRGFLYSGGSYTDLGNLGGFYTNVVPNAINAGGQIVGTIFGYETSGHAFLYRGGSMSDLNNLIDPGTGWILTRASGINDNGQIVGTGINSSFQTHGFLLTPRPTLTNLRVIGSQAQFNLSGMTNVTYQVEYAASLQATNWLVLTNVTVSVSPVRIVDASSTGAGERFYRAVQQ